jgi:hypothetical protein
MFVLPVIIISIMVCRANAQAIYKGVPDKIDKKTGYLFYLHGRIVEIKGPRAVSPKYGAYEYEKILEALKDRGFIVISEVREKGTPVGQYAGKIASRVTALLEAGVPAGSITVVGASKGALIAMQTSTMLANKEINYVILAGCADAIFHRFDIDLYGNILSIYDEKDELVGSCQKFIEKSSGVNKFKEIKLKIGTGHGIIYKPLKEWIDPTADWAGGVDK